MESITVEYIIKKQGDLIVTTLTNILSSCRSNCQGVEEELVKLELIKESWGYIPAYGDLCDRIDLILETNLRELGKQLSEAPDFAIGSYAEDIARFNLIYQKYIEDLSS